MKYVAISIHGSYLNFLTTGGGSVGADIDAALGLLRADGTGIGAPSIFERVERGGSLVSLRMLDGTWLGVTDIRVGHSAGEASAEVFTEVWWPDDRISLRAGNGMFLCAENGGGREIVVNRPEAGDWEKFYYEQVPAELLPDESPDHTAEQAVDSSVADAIREQAEHSRLDPGSADIHVLDDQTVADTMRIDRPPMP